MSAASLNILSNILMYSLLLTAVFSIVVMMGGRSLFRKANRKSSTALYPIVNLFIVLEIGELSIFWGILFFVPIINIFVLCLMFYKLGTVFNAELPFKIGLVLLPIVFYPMLALGSKRYKLSEQECFQLIDKTRSRNKNIKTQNKLNENDTIIEDDEPKVDSIFKSDIDEKKAAEPYKAVRIDVIGLNKLEQYNKNDKIKSEKENNKK